MRSFRVFMAIATAAMLSIPVGAAGWSAYGSIEPDNAYEIEFNEEFNWQDAPADSTNRIYFQAFSSTFGFNPNVAAAGTLETRYENSGAVQYNALLGVWRDCNGDGYIGHVESALYEYPAELLPAGSICEAQFGSTSVETGAAEYAAKGYPSNYNGWVTEFIMIGGSGDDGTEDTNEDGVPDNQEDDAFDARVIRDGAAKIWGDFGLPDDSVAAAGGGTCSVTPLPRGTLQSTGGAINYADCGVGVRGIWNDVFLGRRVLGEDVPGADPENSLGLAFENEDDATEGGHPLHVATFGDDGTEHSAVKTTDCDVLVRFGDQLNSTGAEGIYDANNPDPEALGEDLPFHDLEVYTPAPALTNADPLSWTVPGQVNQTSEEQEDCDTSNDRGDDFYGIAEGDGQGTTQGTNEGKIQAEWNFDFDDFIRGDAPERVVTGDTDVDTDRLIDDGETNGDPTGPSPFLGSFRAVGLVFFAHSIWSGDAGLIKAPSTVRGTLAEGDFEPDQAWRETFYAYVGPDTTSKGFSLPGGGATGKYGQAQCGAFTSGVRNGWNCDPAAWYFNSGTNEPMPEPTQNGGFARVGQPYQLRDLDCYDGGNNLGVPLGAPALGTDPCN